MLLALVVAMLPGGGAPAPRPVPAALASVPAADDATVSLDPHDVYVSRDAPPAVVAYTLPGGHPRWTEAVAGPVLGMWPVPGRPVLLVGSDRGDVRALDTRTGRPLWARPRASLVDAPPGGRVLLLDGGDRLSWVDGRTGEPVWSRPVPPDADVSVAHRPGRPGGLLVTAADGAATLLVEDTGAVLATGQFGSLVGNLVLTPGPPGGTPAPTAERLPVDVLGDQVIVQQRRSAGSGSLTGFDLNTLTPRWTLTADLMGEPFPCGQLLCLGSAEGIRAVDPATGTVRWSTTRWQYLSPLGGGRVLGYGLVDKAVLDAATGRVVQQVDPQWTRVLLGAPVSLLSRPDRRDPRRYWFTALVPDPPPPWYLTGVDGTSCGVQGDLLACQTAGRFAVWRLPVSPARSASR